MNEIVDKGTRFKQVCQLLSSLNVTIIHLCLCKAMDLEKKPDSNEVNDFNELQQI